MLKNKNKSKESADVTFWNIFYFNPIAIRETEQFKREVIRAIKKLKPINYDFEELTAFLVLRVHFNTKESFEKISKRRPEKTSEVAKELLAQIKTNLEVLYTRYLTSLTKRFMQEMKKNKELKESTNILIKKMVMGDEEKTCFAENIYEQIETKSKFYSEVIENAIFFIVNIQTENYSLLEIGKESVGITTDKPIIQILDELILYNFSNKYTSKTIYIIEQFLQYIVAVNKKLKGTNQKSKNFEELLDLLKGKSFEVLDNIHDIRRQIARQNRAEREITNEAKDINDKNLTTLLAKISSKKEIQKIVKLTDDSIENLNKWFTYIRKIENINEIQPEMNISEFKDDICNLFIQMELLRIWSEFFYDISYFTVKQGRVLEPEGSEIKEEIETDAVLVVEDAYKTYKLPKSRVYALRGVSFEIKSGEFLAIMGPSGAGKTTLVNILTGLDTPDKGAVYLNGKNIALLDDTALTEFRRDQIGLIFQFYQLFPELTALENVAMPAEMAGMPVKLAREKAREILRIVDLESFVNQYPDKLSGGQQQRVAIARALVNNPSVVVADQLTGDLDSITGMQIIGYLRKINTEQGVTVLLVTHNKAVATQADRILTIEDGEIIEEIDMTKLRQID